MVSLPSVPSWEKLKSGGSAMPWLSKAPFSSPTVTWPLPSRSRASKICRRCLVSSSLARQARAVIAAFWSKLRYWKFFMLSTTSSMMQASGNTLPTCSHVCSKACMISQRVSAFLRSISASKVFASLVIFFQRLSLKLTGSLRMLCRSSSFVFPWKGYWPDRMMYITTPALHASHFWSYCTGAVTSSGATLYGVPAALRIFVPFWKGQQRPKSISLMFPTRPFWTDFANMMFSVLRSRNTKFAWCR
mmetsp:Transcript_74349/g.195033  ORF Transcript_74349/g.195033 Transcript_74349/m.195033 type:complete len:246 (-) Transcript_74349:554-1291(-)